MLLFIIKPDFAEAGVNTFQYISCYCLSKGTVIAEIAYKHFNTSHVTVYQRRRSMLPIRKCYFNTSHVTVYLHQCFAVLCNNNHFNTSHVTVYHKLTCFCVTIFFYFNTSHVTVYPDQLLGKRPKEIFQYISCYCLSIRFAEEGIPLIDFNTSHVTVYRGQVIDAITEKDFNTSHVTVYPGITDQ